MKLFGAAWCGPCNHTKAKLTAAGFDLVEREPVAPNEIQVVDIDQHIDLARENGVRGIPTLIDGEKRFTGFEPIWAELKDRLEA